MQTATRLSLKLSRQIWVTRHDGHGLRFHLFYRPGMGHLIAVVIGDTIMEG